MDICGLFPTLHQCCHGTCTVGSDTSKAVQDITEYGSPLIHEAARYHSLAAIEETLSEDLVITARAEDGEIMAVEHKEYPVFGVQFHPESVMTPDGRKMIENFLAAQMHLDK